MKAHVKPGSSSHTCQACSEGVQADGVVDMLAQCTLLLELVARPGTLCTLSRPALVETMLTCGTHEPGLSCGPCRGRHASGGMLLCRGRFCVMTQSTCSVQCSCGEHTSE